ncbi:alpha/beta hydrolase family protein [Nocardia stercoris]|uniref:Alpha/beta fold hydrolase n=1 Tax=Nocardia stercoris TaxID=2483361 RepID=A0A3M2KRF3_9NOCA|nr:alpha/beta fold hydrolase [Nocardia stercoris]RMI27651.1 alpha/beta fold hydrolase [Nocardia stercoris]
METVVVRVPDGSTVPVRLIPARGTDAAVDRRSGISVQQGAGRVVAVIVPGLGVPAIYYEGVARLLAQRGVDAAVLELRGNGDSRPLPGPGSAYGYHELAAVDLPAVLKIVRERFPGRTPILVGHSLGGQLSMLYAARVRHRIGGLVLIASGAPDPRGYGGIARPAMMIGPTVAALTAQVAGFWPGDRIAAGGFGRQSKVLIADWARFSRTGRFEPTGADIDYEERLTRLRLPVLSITIAGDELVPRRSAHKLLEKLPNATITRWHNPDRLGHNTWALEAQAVVERIMLWLNESELIRTASV